jgi:hypothetical protein
LGCFAASGNFLVLKATAIEQRADALLGFHLLRHVLQRVGVEQAVIDLFHRVLVGPARQAAAGNGRDVRFRLSELDGRQELGVVFGNQDDLDAGVAGKGVEERLALRILPGAAAGGDDHLSAALQVCGHLVGGRPRNAVGHQCQECRRSDDRRPGRVPI